MNERKFFRFSHNGTTAEKLKSCNLGESAKKCFFIFLSFGNKQEAGIFQTVHESDFPLMLNH